MLGTLVQGRVCVGGAGINAAKVALAIAIKYADRRRQFERRPRTSEEQLLLDYGMHQRRLFPLLARTYALHFAQEVGRARAARGLLRTESPDEGENDHRRRELESRAAGHQGARHLARDPHHPGVPRGLRRRGLPARSTGSPRSRPTPTSSPRSRATTTCCCSWSPRAC